MIDISLTEETIINPSVPPEPLRDWRMYRIEYGGPNEDCIWEGRIMLPAEVDPWEFELFMADATDNEHKTKYWDRDAIK